MSLSIFKKPASQIHSRAQKNKLELLVSHSPPPLITTKLITIKLSLLVSKSELLRPSSASRHAAIVRVPPSPSRARPSPAYRSPAYRSSSSVAAIARVSPRGHRPRPAVSLTRPPIARVSVVVRRGHRTRIRRGHFPRIGRLPSRPSHAYSTWPRIVGLGRLPFARRRIIPT